MNIVMGVYLKDNMKIIKLADMENIHVQIRQLIMEIGWIICNMELGLKYGMIHHNIFQWAEGKKYLGFYKNDKKDGFGIHYWPHNRFFIGFWKCGKQHGIGKYIKGNVIKYGVWKEGKREKWIEEREFTNDLDSGDDNYSYFFQWNITKLKKYMEVNDLGKKSNKSLKFSKFEDISEDHSGNKNRKIKFNDDKEDEDE